MPDTWLAPARKAASTVGPTLDAGRAEVVLLDADAVNPAEPRAPSRRLYPSGRRRKYFGHLTVVAAVGFRAASGSEHRCRHADHHPHDSIRQDLRYLSPQRHRLLRAE